MKSLRILLAAGACVTAGALFGPAFATATAEKVKEVIVKNEDPIPVAVQGTPTVNVGGTPSVRVAEIPAFHDGDREAEVERLRLLTRLGGETIDHSILVRSQRTQGEAASQPIRAHADDPAAAVRFLVAFDQAISETATHHLYATFTGVLFDA